MAHESRVYKNKHSPATFQSIREKSEHHFYAFLCLFVATKHRDYRARDTIRPSVVLVRLYLSIDLRAVRTHKMPRVGKILKIQRWIIPQEVSFICSETSCLFKNPNRNPCAFNTRHATHHVGFAFYSLENRG